jgi:general secretion pathway protein A
MYERFFELKKPPFSLAPDSECVHLTAQYADAISGLAFGVLDRKGYLTLTAEAGLGKTTALRALAQLLTGSNVQSSLIFTPTLTAAEFLELAMLNFGIAEIPASKAQRLKLFETFLTHSDTGGKISALIIDEAHQLSAELLEEVRLLGNFELAGHKLLQIVLVGQNELDDRLNLPVSWQLKQRIAIRLSLRRLDSDGVAAYIDFRWSNAGAKGLVPFTDAAVNGIAAWSNGIPRLVNVICDNALLVAFSQGAHTADMPAVRDACLELSLPTPTLAPRPLSFTHPGQPPPRFPEQPSPSPTGQIPPEAAPHNWVDSRPSLLKRWLHLKDSQGPPVARTKSIYSLNGP